MMKKITDYRRHAEECRALARGAKSTSEHKQLLDMAETWEGLARERERMVKQQQQVAADL